MKRELEHQASVKAYQDHLTECRELDKQINQLAQDINKTGLKVIVNTTEYGEYIIITQETRKQMEYDETVNSNYEQWIKMRTDTIKYLKSLQIIQISA